MRSSRARSYSSRVWRASKESQMRCRATAMLRTASSSSRKSTASRTTTTARRPARTRRRRRSGRSTASCSSPAARTKASIFRRWRANRSACVRWWPSGTRQSSSRSVRRRVHGGAGRLDGSRGARGAPTRARGRRGAVVAGMHELRLVFQLRRTRRRFRSMRP